MNRHSESSTVSIPVEQHAIQGDLTLPAAAKAAVIFAHGSGSSRHSRRNKYVAEIFTQIGLVTLLIDLLTREEELFDIRTSEYRFDIDLLASRLIAATDWASKDPRLSNLALGYFGASTGAAAALVAAAKRPERIRAVVSRGGRPDLAKDELSRVAAPTLLLVGEFDRDVIEMNRTAAQAMHAVTEIKIIAGATHLFEEEGTLEQVALLARDWFERNLLHLQVV
jgi:dienelactone hydrolase